MKRMLIRIILAAAIVLAAAGGCAAESAAPEPAADGATSEWTVLFYLCGSDLESRYSYATAALTDISQVTYPYDFRKLYTQHDTDRSELMRDIGNVNVLIETGGAREWHAQALNLDISPTALQRWRLNYHPVATGEGNRTERAKEKIELLETLPLKSMGEAETLADFIRWGAENYPAKKYALVLWDHGFGAGSGLMIDELFDMDIMYLYELRDALAGADVQLEAVVIDACLMANIETAWSIKDHARWLTASEEDVPGNGTAIREWLQALLDYPAMDGEWLGRCVCDMTAIKYLYGEDKRSGNLLTWSVIDLTGIDRLTAAFGQFFRAAGDAFREQPIVAQLYAQYIKAAEEYSDGQQNMIDFGSVLYHKDIFSYMDEDVLEEAIQALNGAVVYTKRGNGRAVGRGLSFCYPADFTGAEMQEYVRNFPNAPYLAFLDAVSEWTAPEWVYEETERVPNIDTIAEMRITTEKVLTPAAMPGLSFGENVQNVSDVYYNLYRLNEETGDIEWLGRTDCSPERTDRYFQVFRPNDLMQWPSIEGIPCCIGLIQVTRDSRLYNIPVQINTNNAILRCGQKITQDGENGEIRTEYEIYGAWEGYDGKGDLMNRSVTPLAVMAGWKYRMLYPLNGTQNAKEKSYAAGPELTMYRYVAVSETTLPAGTYYLEYEVEDMFMRKMTLEKIPFSWDGRKMTFGDGFSWEGTVDPAWKH